MRRTKKSAAMLTSSFALGVAVIGAPGAIASAAPASTTQTGGVNANANWKCNTETFTGDPQSASVICTKGKHTYFKSNWFHHGDRLNVLDYHDNDRKAVAYLYVQGYGTAKFTTGNYDDLNFPEDRKVELQVCSSSSANAVCSSTYHTHTGHL